MSIWKSMTGTEGEVIVPSIGAVIGTITNWSLRRPEESSSGTPGLTLRASFSYVNEALMNEPDITKHVLITIRKGKRYRVCYERTAFDGMSLVLEGATLCPPE